MLLEVQKLRLLEEAIRWLKLAFNKYEKLGEFQRGDEVKLSLEKLQQQLGEE